MLNLATEPETRAVPFGRAAFDPPGHVAPLAGVFTRAGFPSPAEDFLDDELDLHRLLVRNPAATYLYRAQGWSMMLAGICDGDVLVVDRSVEPRHGDVVVASWDGQQPVCKVLHVAGDHVELHSRNPHCANIVLAPDTDVEIFAVVGVARSLRRGGHVRAG
jgi:DNA polymerase V